MDTPEYSIAAVGLIALCRHGRSRPPSVLMLTERETKPDIGKWAGMASFPMETREHDEPLPVTMARLIDQELTGMGDELSMSERYECDYQVKLGTWLRVWYADCGREALPTRSCHSDVEGHRWVPLHEVIQTEWLRQGAYEALSDRLFHVKRKMCECCREPLRIPSLA